MDTGLRERVVLVTGGSSGIGAATAVAFAREGAKVAITYRKGEEAARAVAAAITEAGGEPFVTPMDLEDLPSARRAVDAVLARWGRVDVLVANAVRWGGDAPDPTVRFEDVPVEEWLAMVGANLVGAAAAVRGVLPGMRARGWGRIVLISSGVAEEGLPGPGPYGTAKAGLHGMARALAWEGGRDGILVNVVAPGFTLTEKASGFPRAIIDQLAAGVPTRRLSDPEDVARLVVFLGSAANGNLTGELVREGSSAARAPHVG
ncbi:SDR family NAD(P)-dependent oxidoreductase [Nonomuraea ferruginea]|uniref:SDR family NAD(P)-dependent oxidoreductase n=1 Tax=Nonomuraea ferruginea TaxID=46174 RepID=A0ABT4SUM6_9ACTN|nr:SDR family NAD(P)-dependent oxidoreductase [Nonomuraea ferruginea]MDA0640974.1 SDR family NAD(P)-dependent oxidoreductase [Nonomuraea ferruginea]